MIPSDPAPDTRLAMRSRGVFGRSTEDAETPSSPSAGVPERRNFSSSTATGSGSSETLFWALPRVEKHAAAARKIAAKRPTPPRVTLLCPCEVELRLEHLRARPLRCRTGLLDDHLLWSAGQDP